MSALLPAPPPGRLPRSQTLTLSKWLHGASAKTLDPPGSWYAWIGTTVALLIGVLVGVANPRTATLVLLALFSLVVVALGLKALLRLEGEQYRAGLWWTLLILTTSATFRGQIEGGAAEVTRFDLQIAVQLAAIGLAAFYIALRGVSSYGTRRWSPAFLLLGGYVLVATISTLYSPNWAYTLVKSFQLGTVVLLGRLIYIESFRDNPRLALNLTYYALGVALVMQWFVRLVAPEFGGFLRFDGFVQLGRLPFHYTTVAGMAGVLTVGLLARWLGETTRRSRMSLQAAWLFAVLTLAVSYGRSDIVFTLLCSALLLILYRRWRSLGMLTTLLALLGVFFTNTIISLAFRGQTIVDLQNLNGRISVWMSSLSWIAERPILGHGYYAGTRELGKQLTSLWHVTQLHNDVLTILFNVGGLGLTCLLGVIVVAVIPMAKTAYYAFRMNWATQTAAELVAITAFILLHGLVHAAIGWDASYMLFVFIAIAATSDHVVNYRRALPASPIGSPTHHNSLEPDLP